MNLSRFTAAFLDFLLAKNGIQMHTVRICQASTANLGQFQAPDTIRAKAYMYVLYDTVCVIMFAIESSLPR